MMHQKQSRGAVDSLLLLVWVVGYYVLIRTFAALQHIERLLTASRRGDTKEARRT
jgi:hypothetical protein